MSGSIDEGIRHAITKLSHVHFTASKDAYNRVLRMGENPRYTFHVGCPRLDIVSETINKDLDIDEINSLEDLGVGNRLDYEEDFALISLHPVTTNDQSPDINMIIDLCLKKKLQVICLWPNADFGTDKIAKSIRVLRESGNIANNKIRFYKNLPISVYIKLMNKCRVLIGNSSSGIREGAFIGTPCINLGDRQKDRERGPNVIDIYELTEGLLSDAIDKHLKSGKYPSSDIYGDGKAAEKMISIIKTINPTIQKEFFEGHHVDFCCC